MSENVMITLIIAPALVVLAVLFIRRARQYKKRLADDPQPVGNSSNIEENQFITDFMAKSKQPPADFDAATLIKQTRDGDRDGTADHGAQDETVDDTPAPVPKDEGRRRESREQDFKSLFMRTTPFSTRSGKTVYIRKEFHDRMMKIVRVIGNDEQSLFSYLDNVLEHHFSTYQETITELYDKHNKGVF